MAYKVYYLYKGKICERITVGQIAQERAQKEIISMGGLISRIVRVN